MITTSSPLPRFSNIKGWFGQHWPVAIWAFVALFTNLLLSTALPDAYHDMLDMSDVPAADRADLIANLSGLHISPKELAFYQIAVETLATIVSLVVSFLLVRKTPRTWFALYLALVLTALTNANYPPAIADTFPDQPFRQLVARTATVIAIGGFFTLPFVFPDGHFVPKWSIPFATYAYFSVVTFAFAPGFDPIGHGAGPVFEGFTTLVLITVIFYSVIYRYRSVSTAEQRRQTRWVMFGLLVGIPGFFLGDAAMRHIDATPVGVVSLLVFMLVMPLATTLPIIAIGLSILQYQLFDIDIVLSRTIVGIIMTFAVTGTYIGIVIGIGSLFESRSNLWLSLFATGLVAVGFQPLLQRVRAATNRFLFGERDDPYTILSRIGQTVETTLNSADLLPQIVRSTADALRLPYVALFLEDDGVSRMVASSGSSVGQNLKLPLTYQGQPFGALEVSPRNPGEVFSDDDRRLLEDLARQVGVAARSVSLAEDLQLSREQLISSREEDRRRLRRELHDGLGAQLAALTMQAGAARTLIHSDPDAADTQLLELRSELRVAIADIRRIALGLRPPALDELGLVGALEARLAHIDRSGLDDEAVPLRITFRTEGDLIRLNAAAEVAAYRIVEEAITNIVKHAQATKAEVQLHFTGDCLLITITDNGIGITPDPNSQGLGLQSMKERATELGGAFSAIRNVATSGTTVRVELPTTTPESGS